MKKEALPATSFQTSDRSTDVKMIITFASLKLLNQTDTKIESKTKLSHPQIK